MSIRKEQCNKVCRILDDVLTNRPTERDSLVIAVRKAFEALELFGNSEQLPSAQPERKTGKWNFIGDNMFECTSCGVTYTTEQLNGLRNYDTDPYAPKFCPNCGADMKGG